MTPKLSKYNVYLLHFEFDMIAIGKEGTSHNSNVGFYSLPPKLVVIKILINHAFAIEIQYARYGISIVSTNDCKAWNVQVEYLCKCKN